MAAIRAIIFHFWSFLWRYLHSITENHRRFLGLIRVRRMLDVAVNCRTKTELSRPDKRGRDPRRSVRLRPFRNLLFARLQHGVAAFRSRACTLLPARRIGVTHKRGEPANCRYFVTHQVAQNSAQMSQPKGRAALWPERYGRC